MPHNDKHYQKLLRTYKLVVYMVLAALIVLGVGLSLMWFFDRLGGSFMSRGWQVFFIIIFALLVAGLQIPGYIMDIRKIEMDNPSPVQPQKPKPYAAILEQARKEDLIDEDNRLQVPRSEFVRFIAKNRRPPSGKRRLYHCLYGLYYRPKRSSKRSTLFEPPYFDAAQLTRAPLYS